MIELLQLLPHEPGNALDIGTRDGFLARAMAQRGWTVTALDLETPGFEFPGVTCVQGDATRLAFADGSFDLVLCAEVLEHIPEPGLTAACSEIRRVTRRHALIGVPHRQDLRLWRTTCQRCGATNPPWGHVNSFDESRLASLFHPMRPEAQSFVGVAEAGTNSLAAALMAWAGNPYGTYSQDEPCLRCGQSIGQPAPRSAAQRVCTRLATWARNAQKPFMRPHANWVHIRFGQPHGH